MVYTVIHVSTYRGIQFYADKKVNRADHLFNENAVINIKAARQEHKSY